MVPVTFRVMTQSDVDFTEGLMRLVGWENPRRDIERALLFEPRGCFVASHEGRDVGVICSFLYGVLGFIGNVITHPDCRGLGVGEAMMRYAVARLEGEGASCIKLDSVEKAVGLYARVGFKPQHLSLRFSGIPKVLKHVEAKRLTAIDLAEAADLDEEYFRHNRLDRLKYLQWDYPDLCFKTIRRGEITGFIMARRGVNSIRVGPWITRPECVEDAETLFHALAGSVQGEAIWVGVPEPNAASVRILEACEIRRITSAIRMYRGKESSNERVEGIFGIGAPDKG